MKLYTRREITKLALTALPVATLWSTLSPLRGAEKSIPRAAKPNSKVAGVQLGLNVPYSFHEMEMSGEEILKKCIALNLSAVELRAQPIEMFMGAPRPPAASARKADATSAEKEAAKAATSAGAEALRQWRLKAPLDRAKKFSRMYTDAGVAIEILKIDNIYKTSDAELDYCFALAKAVGARAIPCELSFTADDTKRVGAFADKHRMMVGYHGHAAVTPQHWETVFAQAKYNGANVDLGHFIAGNNFSPAEFIRTYHDRVTHVHLKDRKKQNGPNMRFGEGDTPIKEVLQMIRDNKWPIQGTIEFEYKVPADSDLMTEIARAVQYCRAALA